MVAAAAVATAALSAFRQRRHVDSGGSSGEGWKYYAPHITLTNGTLHDFRTNKIQVRVVVQQGVTCDVTPNLVIEALGSIQCAHAGDQRLRLALPGGGATPLATTAS